MEPKVCDSCHNKKHVNLTDNRLVTESCGHMKCMDCLLREKSGCLACVRSGQKLVDTLVIEPKIYINGVPFGDKAVQINFEGNGGATSCEDEADKPSPAGANENGQNSDNESESVKKKPDTSHIIELAEGGFMCMSCDRKFNSRSQVQYHSYCNGTPKPFNCTECDKSFVSASHFKYHMRVHRDEREFACDVCGERFIQRSKLQRHKLKHTKEKRYLCSSCPKAFDNRTSLHRHRLTHTRERPYKCDACGARLRDPSNYIKHMLRHKEAERSPAAPPRARAPRGSHACPRCARTFRSAKDLRRHAQVHTDSKPFRCKVCNRRFRRKDNLERHVRNTHSEIAPSSAIERDGTTSLTSDTHIEDNHINDLTEKNKLEILNPLPPLPKEVIQKHLQSEESTVIMDKSYIIEANTTRQTVIVRKAIERKVPSPVQEYVHKIRKAKSMRGPKDLLLPPIDEKKLHDFLEIESNLHHDVGAPHPKNLQIYKNILGLSEEKNEKLQTAGPEVHWRKKKLNINW